MKSRIVTLSLRAIKKNIRRFLSLIILSFLGVAVFVGIKLASSDMMKSVDTYNDMNNVYDLKVISTLGLTEDDVKEINKCDERISVYGSHSKDVAFKSGDTNSIIRIMEFDGKNNNVYLKEGRLPNNKDEIIVEESVKRRTNIKIGDTIELDLAEDDDTVNSKKLTIVGTCVSPIYLINGSGWVSRGNTTIGNGKVSFYSFATTDFFKYDYYTEIYVNVDNNYITDSDEYNNLIDEVKDNIESIKEERQKARYNQIVNEANDEIDKKEKELLEEFDNAKQQLDDAYIQIVDGENQLNSGEAELKRLKQELDNGLEEINNGYIQIVEVEKELFSAKNQLDSAVEEINSSVSEYGLSYNKLVKIKRIIDGKLLTRKEAKALIPNDCKYYDLLIEIIDYIYDNNYDELLSSFINGIDKEEIITILSTINDGKYKETVDQVVELFKSIDKIQDGYTQVENGLEQADEGKIKLQEAQEQCDIYLAQYNSAVALLNSKRQELQEGTKLYQTNLEEYNIRKFDFDENIKKAREKVSETESAKWFIYTRNNNSDYVSYINSVQSVENVSFLFPVVFFAVAVFISLLSMSRMALEDRGEIGTLKSLGFNNVQIRYKYILYSLLATVVGGILGALLGYFFLPWIIFKTYKMLYEIPIFIHSGNIGLILLGITISVVCICGATILTINGLVKEKTTDLLRPKAPPKGKKVLLERMPFVWNKINFTNKVTIRNIFRYKKRVGMTMLGIIGCTVLLLSGYAIRDSIVNIVSMQYSEIFKYDDLVYLDDVLTKDKIDKILDNTHIRNKAYIQIVTVNAYDKDVYLVAPDDEESFKEIITLESKGTKEDLHLESNKVIVTSKFAKMHNLKANDKIEFMYSNNKKYEFIISAITQNYLGDYIYMDKDTYNSSFDKYKINAAYIKVDDIANENEVKISLLENSEVLGVMSTNESSRNLEEVFKSLDVIVIILVVFSGALSFVVLYNLSYINISERQREIATLKVLGFNSTEIDGYIIKEEIIITIVGIILGLIIGTGFGMMLINTIEIDVAEFIRNITTLSYFKTLIFMILFSIVVNVRIHFALKKIDMIESLKSIE